MIVIVDYGVGNLGSIINMFKKAGVKAIASRCVGTGRKTDFAR
jgi:imidazoleglycerol phosphate synthase glutamine amidotransferase subunit HisH